MRAFPSLTLVATTPTNSKVHGVREDLRLSSVLLWAQVLKGQWDTIYLILSNWKFDSFVSVISSKHDFPELFFRNLPHYLRAANTVTPGFIQSSLTRF